MQRDIPVPRRLEAPPNEDYYRAASEVRPLARPGPPGQHRLAKLNVFKGQSGDRLDDFIYQVEEFPAFHTWDPMDVGPLLDPVTREKMSTDQFLNCLDKHELCHGHISCDALPGELAASFAYICIHRPAAHQPHRHRTEVALGNLGIAGRHRRF